MHINQAATGRGIFVETRTGSQEGGNATSPRALCTFVGRGHPKSPALPQTENVPAKKVVGGLGQDHPLNRQVGGKMNP